MSMAVVPHWKALISDCFESGGQGHGSTLSVFHALLKRSILLNRVGLYKTEVQTTVEEGRDKEKKRIKKKEREEGNPNPVIAL